MSECVERIDLNFPFAVIVKDHHSVVKSGTPTADLRCERNEFLLFIKMDILVYSNGMISEKGLLYVLGGNSR